VEITLLRSIVTVVSFVVFVGIMFWVWKNRNSKAFDEAKSLPFNEE